MKNTYGKTFLEASFLRKCDKKVSILCWRNWIKREKKKKKKSSGFVHNNHVPKRRHLCLLLYQHPPRGTTQKPYYGYHFLQKKKKESQYPRKKLIDPRDETKGKVKTLQLLVNVRLVFVCKEILKKKWINKFSLCWFYQQNQMWSNSRFYIYIYIYMMANKTQWVWPNTTIIITT